MSRVVPAALVYAVTVFAIGFVLGAARVLVLARSIGAVGSVLVELPLILAASYFVARRVLRFWNVPARTMPRLLMGGLALAALLTLEVTLSLTLFGNSLDQFFAHFQTPEGLLGLCGQLIFACIPALLLLSPR
ncbi:hypothetical protein [Roseibium sp. M-1]